MHHSMLPLIISCTRPWNFAWHLLCHSTTESKNIVKLSGNEPNHSHRVLQGRLFSKGKISIYLRVCFTQCTLCFPQSLFSIADLFACVICGSYVKMINAVLWHSARHTFASLGTHSRRPDNKYDRRNFILEPPLLLLFLCRGWGGILSISVCCIHTRDTKNHQLYEYEDTYFTVTPGDGGRKKAEREENSLNVISVFHLCNYQRKASGERRGTECEGGPNIRSQDWPSMWKLSNYSITWNFGDFS